MNHSPPESNVARSVPVTAYQGDTAPDSTPKKTSSIPPTPSVSLPKGGGALRGIGEKFQANVAAGTGTLTVPIKTSPSRSRTGPQLAISYDSGKGNGPFGLGWQLSAPAITRKTDKGLPRYQDSTDSDVFIISGAEDLVPIFAPDASGNLVPEASGPVVAFDEVVRDGFTIRRYRPRVESAFALIQRWTRQSDGDVHWKSISPDNVTTKYGKDANSRISCPVDASLIFSWLICESYDCRGNAVVYEYKPEDSVRTPLADPCERNRTALTRSANRYIKTIKYGNRQPNRDSTWQATSPADLPSNTWMFNVVFDYGEHDLNSPSPEEPNPWICRPDTFSTYRPGFEVRTYRLCRRVLVFHLFPTELGPNPYLVSSTSFEYESDPVTSYLATIVQSGHVRLGDANSTSYRTSSIPPLQLEYSKVPDAKQLATHIVEEVDIASLANLPCGVDGVNSIWVDLDGEGLPGIFSVDDQGWFYKRNFSATNRIKDDTGSEQSFPKFGPLEPVSTAGEHSARQPQLMSLAADGRLDVVSLTHPAQGFYRRTEDGQWSPFQCFASWPNVDPHNPNLRFVDLNGDGLADILIIQNEVITWYPSLGEIGFGRGQCQIQAIDEKLAPRLVFTDGEEAIYLADFSGDGLSDLVRIRNAEICYWPNTGYGRFGPQVIMGNVPWFDYVDRFDQRRIRLADIDGSGTADIIYLGSDSIDIYHNQAGNSFSDADHLTNVPSTDQLSSINAVDLLGNGTSCLVWSSPIPTQSSHPMKYLRLMGNIKPHLLTGTINNLGAETRIQYVPSTYFYLQDRQRGMPWATQLPFPVQCVQRVETRDHISHNRFVSRYAYHHGYFDSVEREFNGFGMVEQWDTEEFGALESSVITFPDVTNEEEHSHVPPVHTKTWYHQGVFINREEISRYMAREYYGAKGLDDQGFRRFLATLLDDTVLPSQPINGSETREACRALKGTVLRQEVYADDGSDKADIPYSIIESNYAVELVQPQGENLYAVFSTHTRENLTYHHERNASDPRIKHELSLEVDSFGNVLRSVAIGYGRRPGLSPLQGEDVSKQEQLLITYTETDYTNAIQAGDDYRTPLQCECRAYELSGFIPSDATGRFDFATFAQNGFSPVRSLAEIPFEQENAPQTLQKRMLHRSRTQYRSDNLSQLLPVGQGQPMALPGRDLSLAFTPGLLAHVYVSQDGSSTSERFIADPTDVVGRQAGLLDADGDGHWWQPSGRVFFHPDPNASPQQELQQARAAFFMEQRFTDALGNNSTAEYDANPLLLTRTNDALGNTMACSNDYRVLEAVVATDPNENRSTVAYDALGLVVGTAVMGKSTESLGDILSGFRADLDPADIAKFFAHPKDEATATALLAGATTRIVYDLDRYWLEPDPSKRLPAFAAILAREQHDSDLPPGSPVKIQVNFSYSDGFGREIQKKVQSEPGLITDHGAIANPRWVGSGWTISNNKGSPVRQYEPFFDDTHEYKFDNRVGVSPINCYDPLGRVVLTIHPDHSWNKVLFDPWQAKTYDVNDTVLQDPKSDADVGKYFIRLPDADYLPTWHTARKDGALGTDEQSAANKAAAHDNTPSTTHFDVLGHAFLAIADNKTDGLYQSRISFDIKGNRRKIFDAKNRIVMLYDYDMLSTAIHQSSMEAGERWILSNATGHLLLSWNTRRFRMRLVYDALCRKIETHVQRTNASEQLIERIVYGETLAQPESNNQRGQTVQVFDQAGSVRNEAYDFKGNLLSSQRQYTQDYKTTPDWATSVALESDVYTNSSTYDALNRITSMNSPDGSVTKLSYSESSFLQQIQVNIKGEKNNGQSNWNNFVSNIDYDAKGQRTKVEYGNNSTTTYSYDSQTFRLAGLKTNRASGDSLQDLQYTYDPVGNVVHIGDNAQQTIFFRNRRVEPSTDYTYDPIYRLVQASGREHLGLASNGQANPSTPPSSTDAFRTRLDHPGDGNALGTYVESYVYDAVDNILAMKHVGSDSSKPGWTRAYTYNETSQLEAGQMNNRVTSTSVGSVIENYGYDTDAGLHGLMTSMVQLSAMQWDYKDQLQMTSQQVVNNGGVPERTWYVYDASGQRARKVTERASTDGQQPRRLKERLYLGVVEIFRTFSGDGNTVSLERESLHVMDHSERLAIVESRTKGSDDAPQRLVRYQYSNHLGSAALELDDQAQIISYEEYYPFGSTAYQAVRSQVETPKRYRYTGKERDEENGLYYHGARYYAPWLGRWTSCDPKDIADGYNLYHYCHNNPIKLSDPTGTLSWGQIAGIGAAIVVGAIVTAATAGLAGPAVGIAGAAIIGAIGGAAGGAVGSAIESKIDKGHVDWGDVAKGAISGAIIGGALAGAGAAASAFARSSVGQAAGRAIASSAVGKFVGAAAKRAASSAFATSGVGRGVARVVGAPSRGLEAIRETTGAWRLAGEASRVEARMNGLASVLQDGRPVDARPTAAMDIDIPQYQGTDRIQRSLPGQKPPAAKAQTVPHTPTPPENQRPIGSFPVRGPAPKNPPGQGHVGSRAFDSEVKQMNHVVNNVGDPSKATGSLYIRITDQPCPSCTNGIYQLTSELPNVNLHLWYPSRPAAFFDAGPLPSIPLPLGDALKVGAGAVGAGTGTYLAPLIQFHF